MPNYAIEIRYRGLYETEMEAETEKDAIMYAEDELDSELSLHDMDMEYTITKLEEE